MTVCIGDRVRVVKNRFRLSGPVRVELQGETGTVVDKDEISGRGCDVLVQLDRARELWNGTIKTHWWCGFDELEPIALDEITPLGPDSHPQKES